METSDTASPAAKPVNNNRKSKQALRILKWAALVVILLAIGAAAGYFYRDHNAKSQLNKKDSDISSLNSQLTTAKKDLAAAKAASTSTTTGSITSTTTTPAGVQPSATTIANIHDSITSGNTAALEGYMATTVRVIIAASEGVGNRTPAQAVSDITTWLTNTTSPWNFRLPAATLTAYRAGAYAQYFPTTAYVGKSNNGYVISFQFDANAKISGVFLAAPGVL